MYFLFSGIDPVAKGLPNLWGKEVSMRYTSGLKSKGTFYTDSNGREMVKRVYNKRGPSYPPLNVTEPIAVSFVFFRCFTNFSRFFSKRKK